LSDSNSAVCVLHLYLPRGISIVSTSRELFKVANGDTIRGLSHSLHKIQIRTTQWREQIWQHANKLNWCLV